MSYSLNIAAASVNQLPMDMVGNRERIVEVIEQAQKRNVHILCFPELCITGYGCEDWFLSRSTASQAFTQLESILPVTVGIAVLVGLPFYYRGQLYNCAALLKDKQILGMHAKKVLAREGVYYEPRWFTPWKNGESVEVEYGGYQFKFGDFYYKFDTLGLAIQICEEAWVASNPLDEVSDDIDIVLNPSASNFALEKYRLRRNLVAETSRSMRAYYVYANYLGLESGSIIYDGGNLIAHNGAILSASKRFSYKDNNVTLAEYQSEKAANEKLLSRSYQDPNINQKAVASLQAIAMPSHWKQTQTKSSNSSPESNDQETTSLPKNEEFLRALALGLFDYFRKSRCKAYVVSLSGGCDSSAVALAVAQMLALGCDELGLEALCGRLNLEVAPSLKALIKKVLHTVYLETANNSSATAFAAESLAKELGASFSKVGIDKLVASYTSLFCEAQHTTLTWANDDITLQNLQARVRAPYVWMLANKLGGILLSTSNRSEASVGYATMDGDMAGGLAPIAGVAKSFLQQFLVWQEKECSIGLGLLDSLKNVNRLPPSAELRPKKDAIEDGSQQQEDEIDLMPYKVLDYIEEQWVCLKLPKPIVSEKLVSEFPEYSENELSHWFVKFCRLWQINQWKRERLATAFHLDRVSEDPRYWARYPVLSKLL